MKNPTRIEAARRALCVAAGAAIMLLAYEGPAAAAAPTPISISQVPLTVAIPAHPQILLAIGNSQSMDGNLSGAIMTGSGSLGSSVSSLQNSSSPVNFTIPTGFTPPLDAGTGDGTAPYTVSDGGYLKDNSPSRLNVAKAGITSILNRFMTSADFGLIDYSTWSIGRYTTWLYAMSPTDSGFIFTDSPPAGTSYITNPCYGYSMLSGSNPNVYTYCNAIAAAGVVTGDVDDSKYVLVSATSDDPLINDVLYAGGMSTLCVVYGGPSPSDPWPPHHTLGQYNSNPGNVTESYSNQTSGCARTTAPTNAGYVPYTPQTMYIERGFGYYSGGQSATTGNVLVEMTSAGEVPTASSVSTAIAKFTPYLEPETNSTSTSEIKATGLQSALPGLLSGALNYYETKNPASSNGCDAERYVVLVTDGLPTLDSSGHSWPPPGTTLATEFGVTVAFNGDGSLDTGGTNDTAVKDTITAIQNLADKGIKTYVIGLGAGVDPSVNPTAASVLTAMSVAGGTGAYFPATSPDDLTSDMQVILAKILAATQSTASTSVNTTGLNKGSVAYLASFTTSDDYQDWTGDLHAYPIDPATGDVDSTAGAALWSARSELDAKDWDSGRLVATWDPVAGGGTPFRWNDSLAPAGISSSTALGMALSTLTIDMNGADIVDYLRGDRSKEQVNGGVLRNRTHLLGDIVSSAPVYVGAPQGFSQSSSYLSFMANHKSRTPLIYIGANDGMLHAFDASTGEERFAYIPNGVFSKIVDLADPYYNEQHEYFVNGTPVAADVQFDDDSWHTMLVGNEGAGGKSVFALDVTDADTVSTEAGVASMALWEFTDTDLGLTFSEPSISRTNDGWLVFFGNGYDSTNEKPVLYALDPQTGTQVAKLDLCAMVSGVCDSSVANGLSSVSVVNSYGELSHPADTLYAGDLQGNVWRVDISNSDPSSWTVKVIFQARDASGNYQPITTAPAVALNPLYPRYLGTMVYVGTGQLLGLGDLSTNGVQSLYGIYDAPTDAVAPIGFAGIPTRDNLVQQTLGTSTAAGKAVRIEASTLPVNLPTDRGWFIDFDLASGERFVTDPVVEAGGGLVVTSYQPNSDSCSSGGNAWLTVLDNATGGAFTLPELDVSVDGKLDSGDQTASGKNPIGMSLGSVFASAPTIVRSGNGASAGGVGRHKMIGQSDTTILNVGDRGRGKGRIGWWEVRH